MSEAKETSKFVKALNQIENCWAWKIPDSPINEFTKATTKFTPPKPFDVLCCYEGRAIGFEMKYQKKFKPFSIKDLRLSQVAGLAGIETRGKGHAAVILFVGAVPYFFEWSELKTHHRFSTKELLERKPIKNLKPLLDWMTI